MGVLGGEVKKGRSKKGRKKDCTVCGVVKAWATSDPTVAGSIPASDESHCSSVVEHRTNTRAADSRPRRTPGWRGEELLRL